MASMLIDKMRKVNRILQNTEADSVSFSDICRILMDIFNANVYISSKKGKVLGVSLYQEADSPLVRREETNDEFFPTDYNRELLNINETYFNITGDDLIAIFKNDIESFSKLAMIVPVLGSGKRLGTLVIARSNDKFNDEDLILAEYAATVVGLEIIRSERDEYEQIARKKAVVQMAVGTLSFSELEAIECIFSELDGYEGLLVASKIADKAGITRSGIVNALRKFESAGVIESRSLGMKGTYIRVLNEMIFDELNKLKK